MRPEGGRQATEDDASDLLLRGVEVRVSRWSSCVGVRTLSETDRRSNGLHATSVGRDRYGGPTVASATPETALLRWFAANGRDLPWRKTRDPYAILVSELMLQQTQVARVIPRYLAWLERWPTAAALAEASPAEAIRAWQGLGYNRRAVSLHRAAVRIAADGWPDDLTELPGVGPYTAAAVRNFAYGEPVLPVDVNVARILDRTGHSFGPRCAQALMDLGATTCLARVPRCGACPLATGCPARGTRHAAARKQSPFEGSFRQRRAATLRLVAERECPLADLDGAAVASLERDGLVVRRGDVVVLPA
jgi:A/G-specific adenine glycosylase